jgi:hypothetical protein
MLFADYTTFVVTSIMYIVINQKFNSNLHHISKWFYAIYIVLYANQTYIVKFTFSKSLIYPFNIIYFDQIFAIAETINFLCLHLDSQLS